MLIRDSGVVQLFAESAQEVYDLMVQLLERDDWTGLPTPTRR